jgi:hypothetical protein
LAFCDRHGAFDRAAHEGRKRDSAPEACANPIAPPTPRSAPSEPGASSCAVRERVSTAQMAADLLHLFGPGTKVPQD